MDKEKALKYCYEHKHEYKSYMEEQGENGQRMFNCLISIIECRINDVTDFETLLIEYGMMDC